MWSSITVLALALIVTAENATTYTGQQPREPSAQALQTEWLELLAEAIRGDAEAQFRAGVMYRDGTGVRRSDEQAAVWFRRAAEQGHALAQFNLSGYLYSGRGVSLDRSEAVVWCRKAAEQGVAGAQYLLGRLYQSGGGVAQSDAQAVFWYRKAAEQGFAEAQVDLGVMYAAGSGLPQSDAQAAVWFRKAAEQGNAAAQCFLGVMYEVGRGVPQDYTQAHKWLNLAASRAPSDKQAEYAAARNRVARMATPEQVAEAQRLAQTWTPAESSSNPSVDRAVSRAMPSVEPAIKWRRANPSQTEVLQLKAADKFPSTNPDVFERSAAAVVSLRGSQGTGTGFLITRDGLALTNHHVVDKQNGLSATLRDGRQLAVRVLRSSPDADVALIQVHCASDCFTLDLTRGNPTIGRDVYVIGNALALDFTLTRGIVSGLRLVRGVTLVQTDAAINPGNSGGPIIDAKTREVLAIVASKVTAEGAEGVGFGVAIGDALRVLGIQSQ